MFGSRVVIKWLLISIGLWYKLVCIGGWFMERNQLDFQGLLEDLQIIKNALNRHNQILATFLEPGHFALMSIILGLGVTFTLGGLEVLSQIHDGYQNIPPLWQGALLAGLALAFVIATVLKVHRFRQVTKQFIPTRSYLEALIRMFNGPVLPVYSGVLLSMVFIAVYQVNEGQGVILISLFGPFLGVLWNLLGGLIRSPIYWFTGYWFLAIGGLSLFWVEKYPLGTAAVIYGLGILIFGLGGLRTLCNREGHGPQ